MFDLEEIIDSRNIIARIEELENTAVIDREEDEQDELDALYDFQEKAVERLEDWKYGVTFIREDHFAEYAEELVKDLGYIPEDLPSWIANHIDWDEVAEEVKEDYTEFELMGETYWARN